jgi:hemolysin III
MSKTIKTVFYPPFEEKINIISHGIGIIMSVIASVFLIVKGIEDNNAINLFSYIIYGLSLTLLYSASTIYHNSKTESVRRKLNIFDHASIYVLIAGTYTPYSLITLHGTTGWIVFGIIWGLAISGVILKLFFIGKYKILSTAMYVFMGWLMIIAISPMIENLSKEGLIWLLAGGISYTIGAVLYSIKKIKFNHAIFHILVLIGSVCHFISIYFYV